MKKQIHIVRPFVQTTRLFWPAVLSTLLLCVSAASAQVLTWDPGHTPATGSDGSGTWSTTAGTKNPTNWASGGITDVVWDNVSSASIGAGGTAGGTAGATGSISIKVPVTVNNIIFNQEASGSYLLSGSSAVTFTGGTNEVDNTAAATVYHDFVLAGSVGFTKTGAGTLIFSGLGTPTFSGLLHVADGELQLSGSAWTYSAADLEVDSGATFDVNGQGATVGALIGAGTVNNSHASSDTLTVGGDNDGGVFSGTIENTGQTTGTALTKTGTGTETLSGTSSYGGATTVSNGTLLVNGSIGAGGVTVASGATFGGTGSVGGKVTYSSGAFAEFSPGSTMAISGALVAAGNTVELNLPSGLADGNYTLATYNATGSSGSFALAPAILTGTYADPDAVVTLTNGAGNVVLVVQACTAAGISQNPVSVTAFNGGTATFSVTATGSSPTYDWQVNTGSGFADVTGGTGQGTSTYTTATLTGAENGWQYHCIVSVACDSTSQTSTAATLTEVSPGGYSFRSITSGSWSSPSTWQQSPDGITWSAATSTPFSGNSNILIQAGNTVTVTAPVTIDHTVIQAGGEVDVSGATLTITGSSTPDVDVSGNLELLATAGGAITENGTPDVVFENGSQYVSQSATAPAVPTATWATNSTCSIAPSAAGDAVPTGLTGQTFGNFTWNWPTQNGSVNLAGALTAVAGNFQVTAGSTLTLTTHDDASTYLLTVGGAVEVNSGGGKLAVAGGSPTGSYTIQTGGGIIVNTGGTFDFGNQGTANKVLVDFTGSAQWNTMGTVDNIQNVSWKVNLGSTLSLDSSIVSTNPSATFDANGTLTFNTSQITFAGTVTNAATAVVNGNGIGQLVLGTGTIDCGGTLNLGTLPTLTSGQIIQLYTGSTYSGSFTINPATPPGFASWVNDVGVNGSLVVSGTVVVSPKITSTVLAGGNLTLSGSGAPVTDGFTVYGSASLTTPRSSWTSTGVTGTSDGSGNFSATINSATSAGAYQFYTIKFN